MKTRHAQRGFLDLRRMRVGRAVAANIASLTALSADLGNIVAGTATFTSNGSYIRMPAISYDGNGIFLGFHNGEPAFSVREGNDFLRYKPSIGLEMRGSVQTKPTGTFTPIWSGFSTSPGGGDITFVDLGDFVFVHNTALMQGVTTSGSIGWASGTIPSSIRPSGTRRVACAVINNGNKPGAIDIESNGGMELLWAVQVGASDVQYANSSASSVTGGLPAGFTAFYPK